VVNYYQAHKKKPNQTFGFFFDYVFYIITITIIVTLIWQIFISNNVFSSIHHINSKIKQQQLINKKIALENKHLQLEINTISDKNLEILESQARYKLGMIKKGETFYKIKQ